MPHSPTWAHPVPVRHPHSFTLPCSPPASLLSPSPCLLYPFSTFLVCIAPPPPPSVTSLYQSLQGYLSISYKVQSLPKKEIREDAAMWWSSSSHPPLCPFLLPFACAFILFYQKLCSVFTFANVRARACSVCFLFVFISAAGIFKAGNRRKQVWHRAWHLVVWATSRSRERKRITDVCCMHDSQAHAGVSD